MDNTEFLLAALLENRQMAAKVDTEKGQLCFMKCEDGAVQMNIWLPLIRFFRDYIRDNAVFPEDVYLFDTVINLDELRYNCMQHKSGVLFSFRRVKENTICWTRLMIDIPAGYCASSPYVLLCWRDLTVAEAEEQDASYAISHRILKAVKWDIRQNRVRLLRLPREERMPDIPVRSDPSMLSDRLNEENYVHIEDLDSFRQKMDQDHVTAYFAAGNSEMSVFYRRKVGTLYRWCRLSLYPASEFSAEQPVFFCFVTDENKTMLNLLSSQGREQFIRRHKDDAEAVVTYYENVMNVLHYFTQRYLDFFIVDLIRDQYIKYKVDRNILEGISPYVGCFSVLYPQYLAESVIPEDRERLMCYSTIEKLQEILEERASFEYSYRRKDGKRCRTVCTKIESSHGKISKVLFRTILSGESERMKVKTFGNFEVYDSSGQQIIFTKKKSKQLLAYLIDKYGFSVATADIVVDVLEKEPNDRNAIKYVSSLFRTAVKDLERSGYRDIILKEWNSLRINVDMLDCDYYHLIEGDASYWGDYHNEYMKEYSWAEETNAELLQFAIK